MLKTTRGVVTAVAIGCPFYDYCNYITSTPADTYLWVRLGPQDKENVSIYLPS